MAAADEQAPPKRRPSKTLYLDRPSQDALEFLKQSVPKGGLRFSNTVLFREMLDHLKNEPESMLDIEHYPKRGQDRGKFVCIPLADADIAIVADLEDYYQQNARVRQRVRDGSPKVLRLPISQLYANFVRARAVALGWMGG